MPELEEETALANIALDLLGQARMLLARAGQAEGAAAGGTGRGEDQLAFFRDEHEFRNVRLAEHADADFAELTGPSPGLLGLAAGAVRAAGRLGRPGARGHRGQERPGTRLPPGLRRPVGDQARRRHAAVARQDAGRARGHLAAHRRAVPGRPGHRPAARGGRRSGGPARRGRRRARHGARRGDAGPPAGRPAGPGGGPGPGATACTPSRSAICSPSCRAWPAPIRTPHGDARRAGTRRRARGRRDRARSRAAPGDRGRPGHPARGRRGRRAPGGDDHPHLLGLPGAARDRARPEAPARRGRASPRSPCAPRWRPRGAATGSPPRAAASSGRRASPRRTRPRGTRGRSR